MFNEQELQQLSYFLNKCTLTGNESLAHANLLIKIQNLLAREKDEE
jgi:hypothetical protein